MRLPAPYRGRPNPPLSRSGRKVCEPAGFRRARNGWVAAVALLAVAVGVGCDSGPTHPDESIVVTGSLAAGQTDEYPLPLTFEGLVRFTIQDLALFDDGELVELPVSLAVGFGLGRPTDEGCQGTSRLALGVDQSRTYRLLAELYCIALFDPGTLTESQTLAYTVLAETTD